MVSVNETPDSKLSSAFQLHPLVDFPHFFTFEERAALTKWGAHASGLTDGSVLPTSEKERAFVDVARGLTPPETRFQRTWLRYLQAAAVHARLRECEAQQTATASDLEAAKMQIENLHEDVVRLTKWGKLGWERSSLDRAGPASETAQPIQVEGSVYESSIGAAREVTNREQYLVFIKDGLLALSDSQVFAMFNLVDGRGLTSQEMQNYSVEHDRRKAKYRPNDEWGRDDGFVVYANTDGQ